RIATRKSRLALWQAEHVAACLAAAHPGIVVHLLPMVTEGDRIEGSLAAAGGKGLFIKELEAALLAGRAEIAVHSMKDMPAELSDGLVIGAALERADPRDAFVSARHASLAALPRGACVGTSSLRRQSQLRHRRPDLEIRVLRGNVETRLRKLDAGEFDATVLAAAGLDRLELSERIRERLAPEHMLPAAGQGVIGVECRDDAGIRELLRPLDHAPTHSCLDAERAFSARLGGSCQSPIAAYAELEGGRLRLRGLAGSPDGVKVYFDVIEGPEDLAASLGTQLGERVLAAGADALLRALAAATGH
ncbi:MAG: hydroxymethylbilane synthase, partial [Pseudomonadota bacterium]|nr:hydroxymethylbilane synthase [Pseudomonadota bacterium]